MALAVFTAIVGMAVAPSDLDALHVVPAILAIAVGAGAAGMLNMWRDADVDALMSRTAGRPIPRGSIAPVEALVFGLVLASVAVALLAIASNVAAAGLLAFTIFFYVVVYTAWLKRRTPQNIVIGGAAGALPPVIGWTAATGGVGLEPAALFLKLGGVKQSRYRTRRQLRAELRPRGSMAASTFLGHWRPLSSSTCRASSGPTW
jgi:protoheme IX farnesyltransferase